MHPLNPVAIRPERVEELSQEIGHILLHDLDSIRQLNMTTRLLSLNARIEAARAGASGATFAVVANEVMNLAKSMDASFQSIESRTTPLLQELGTVGSSLARDVRGKRLADLAATHLDLVDRNLYERSCDVRDCTHRKLPEVPAFWFIRPPSAKTEKNMVKSWAFSVWYSVGTPWDKPSSIPQPLPPTKKSVAK